MSAPEKLHELVEMFRRNEQRYNSSDYKEMELRSSFIDPFLELFDWHPRQESNVLAEWRDCIQEATVEGAKGEARKRPDYECRIGQTPVMYVEVKTPHENIHVVPKPALQLRSYTHSNELPVGVLTNFAKLAVYDGRFQPKLGQGAEYGRILKLSYPEYVENWDLLYSVISKNAIISGSQQDFVHKQPTKGIFPIGKAILAEIEGWREDLANSIAHAEQNQKLKLNGDSLGFAVGRIIDRILFIRVSEAKGLEHEEPMRLITKGDGVYKRLLQLFHYADARYNSGLFHFKPEQGREDSDELALKLHVGDKVLRNIIDSLYSEDNLTDFSKVPVEILGQVYEQFLGKVITLPEPAKARIEDNPRGNRDTGVFYTPSYIVKYIVDQTLSPFTKGKTPKDIANLKILDPACGSGSFLLGAYDFLLTFYQDYYRANNPAKHPAKVTWTHQDGYKLTLRARKEILLAHIFGVDIDFQAVEVTKLSLLLKVLDGETKYSIDSELKLLERALPDLWKNIKCGNSLLEKDWEDMGREVTDDELDKLKPFDWGKGFPAIMKQGGFDAVIGNPPYVRQETLGQAFKDYAKKKFEVYNGIADLYTYFFERSHKLLKPEGRFGMICSNKWLRADYGKGLRAFMANQTTLEQIVDFGELKVFENAATFPAIFITRNHPTKKQNFVYAPVKTLKFPSLEKEVERIGLNLDSRSIAGYNWALVQSKEQNIIDKMNTTGVPLGKYVDGQIFRGILTGLNEAFVVDKATRDALVKEDKKCAKFIKPFVKGDDVRKYHIKEFDRFVIAIPKGTTMEHWEQGFEPTKWFQKTYPSLYKHLKRFSSRAAKRTDQGDFWWELRACDYYDAFEKSKIVYPDIAKESRFTFDDKGLYFGNTVYFISSDDKYLLGLLNSKLMFAYFKRHAAVLGDADQGGRLRFFRQDVLKLPIRKLNLKDKAQKAQHDQMVKLVKRMLDLNEQLKAAWVSTKQERIKEHMTETDAKIDQLVYELYGLNEQEIAIVEGKS